MGMMDGVNRGFGYRRGEERRDDWLAVDRVMLQSLCASRSRRNAMTPLGRRLSNL